MHIVLCYEYTTKPSQTFSQSEFLQHFRTYKTTNPYHILSILIYRGLWFWKRNIDLIGRLFLRIFPVVKQVSNICSSTWMQTNNGGIYSMGIINRKFHHAGREASSTFTLRQSTTFSSLTDWRLNDISQLVMTEDRTYIYIHKCIILQSDIWKGLFDPFGTYRQDPAF